MRILKRAAPLALVLVLGSQGSALATTRNVTIADFSFTPKVTRARLGDTVKVRFNSKGHPLGKYQFRARLRNTSNHHVSGFSPAVTITVSSRLAQALVTRTLSNSARESSQYRPSRPV